MSRALCAEELRSDLTEWMPPAPAWERAYRCMQTIACSLAAIDRPGSVCPGQADSGASRPAYGSEALAAAGIARATAVRPARRMVRVQRPIPRPIGRGGRQAKQYSSVGRTYGYWVDRRGWRRN